LGQKEELSKTGIICLASPSTTVSRIAGIGIGVGIDNQRSIKSNVHRINDAIRNDEGQGLSDIEVKGFSDVLILKRNSYCSKWVLATRSRSIRRADGTQCNSKSGIERLVAKNDDAVSSRSGSDASPSGNVSVFRWKGLIFRSSGRSNLRTSINEERGISF